MAMTVSRTKPTEAQTKVMNFILEFWKTNMYSPTIKEIADGVGVYPNAVEGQVKILAKKGFVLKKDKISRSIVPAPIAQHLESLNYEVTHTD